MKKVFFKTFGCRTNKFDTQIMIDSLKNYQVTQDLQAADAVVINSCTVTNGADSGVRNFINKIARSQPQIEIFFTGCGVSTQGKSLQEKNLITSAFSSSLKENINSLLSHTEPFFKLAEQNHIDTTVVSDIIGNSRAFIKIQEGCNFDCSYCIIPTVRGGARSLKEATILQQVQTLVQKGFSEFILTGTNVGSYGKETHTSLAQLLTQISKIDGVRRVRIGSLEPLQITDEFLEALLQSKADRYLHIALQHTSDTILERMRRRNRFASDWKLLKKIADLGFAIGTDFIVGFPTESKQDWKEALSRVQKLPLTHIHGFTYSKRDGTDATQLRPEVPGDVAKKRLKELTSIVEEKNNSFRQNIKAPLEILVEKSSQKDGIFNNYGLDQFFNKVTIQSRKSLIGRWIEVENFQIDKGETVASYDL